MIVSFTIPDDLLVLDTLGVVGQDTTPPGCEVPGRAILFDKVPEHLELLTLLDIRPNPRSVDDGPLVPGRIPDRSHAVIDKDEVRGTFYYERFCSIGILQTQRG